MRLSMPNFSRLNAECRVKSAACLIASLILVAVSFNQLWAESKPIGIEVRYSVVYGDLEIGKSVRTVVNGNDGFAYAVHSLQVSGLLRLLGEESYTQRSAFRFQGNKVMPIAFKVTNESNNEIANGEFNWDIQTVTLGNGNIIDMPEHEILDWESWYVAMIIARTEDLEKQRVTIVEQERLRTYDYQGAQPDQLEFRGEAVNTIRIKMQDVNDGRRSYVVWISPQLHNIPVRIDKVKKGQRVSFVAKSFDWVYPE